MKVINNDGEIEYCVEKMDDIERNFIESVRDPSLYSKKTLSKIAIKAMVVASKEGRAKIITALDKE